jgi:hypothetical protein
MAGLKTSAAAALVLLAPLLPHGTASRQDPLPATFSRFTVGPHGGSIWRGVIPGARRKSAVYLPPGFDTGRRYPVVYLLHGMPGSPWSYVNSLSLAALADTLVARREVQPFIAVVPVAGRTGHYAGEWAGPWERYLIERVVPWVDANLPTIESPHGRTLAGLSAGGYGAVDIGLRHPLLFSRLESWGGYFEPFRDGPLAHVGTGELAAHDPTRLAGREAPLLRRLGLRVFLSSGPGHGRVSRRDTVTFARELARLGIPHRLVILGSRRDEWERQLAAGLRWTAASP